MSDYQAFLEAMSLDELLGYAQGAQASLTTLRDIWKDSLPTAPVRAVIYDHLVTIEVAFRRLSAEGWIRPPQVPAARGGVT